MQQVNVAMDSMGSMDNYGIYIVLSQTVVDMGRIQTTQGLLMNVGPVQF